MSEINKSPWPGPKGLIPVTSGRAEDANIYNRNYPPIMMPAFSHLNKVGKDDRKPMIGFAKEHGAAAVGIDIDHVQIAKIPFGVAPLQILPRIKEALKDSNMTIFVDCSMDTGYDAYKALALGADAISVGRGILSPLLKEGEAGAIKKVQRMNEELSELMIYTAIKDTKSFDPSVLYV